MLEQSTDPPQKGDAAASEFSLASNRQGSSFDREARLEDYLDHLCAPLVGIIPYETRVEIRTEIRNHLTALITECGEVCETEEQALTLALRQFGDPRQVALEWLEEWKQTEPSSTPLSSRPAAFLAFTLFGTASLLAIGIQTLWIQQTIRQGDADLPMFLVAFGLPLLAGSLTGIRAASRPMMGVFWALALLILPATALSGWLTAHRWDWTDGAMLGCFQLLFWMPMGCAAAGLAAWLKQRSLRQLRRWAV